MTPGTDGGGYVAVFLAVLLCGIGAALVLAGVIGRMLS